QSGEDLTQATLTQIVLETGHAARFLPVQLLTQMIRLSDDALGEFFSRYVTGALDMYLQAKRGLQTITSYNPLAQIPVAASDPLPRMWMGSPYAYGQGPPPGPPPPYGGYASPPYVEPPPPPEPEPEMAPSNGDRDRDRGDSDVAAMRRELDELKQ